MAVPRRTAAWGAYAPMQPYNPAKAAAYTAAQRKAPFRPQRIVDTGGGAMASPEDLVVGGETYIPDYQGALAAMMGGYEGAVRAADVADEADYRGMVDAWAVGHGGDLSGLVGQGLISQDVANKAAQNEFSTMKEFGRQLEKGTAGGQANLLARGALSSGALPVLQASCRRATSAGRHRRRRSFSPTSVAPAAA